MWRKSRLKWRPLCTKQNLKKYPFESAKHIRLDFPPFFLSNQVHIWATAYPRTAARSVHVLCGWPGTLCSSQPAECQLSLVFPQLLTLHKTGITEWGSGLGPKTKVGCNQQWRGCCVYMCTCESGFRGENSNTQIGGSAGVSVSTLVEVVPSEPTLKQKGPQPLGFVLTHQTDL